MNTQVVITRTELASYLGIHRKTLWERLKNAGVDIPARQLLTPSHLKKILLVLDIDDFTWAQIIAQKKRK